MDVLKPILFDIFRQLVVGRIKRSFYEPLNKYQKCIFTIRSDISPLCWLYKPINAFLVILTGNMKCKKLSRIWSYQKNLKVYLIVFYQCPYWCLQKYLQLGSLSNITSLHGLLGWYHNIYKMYQLWKVMCAFIKMSKSFTASLSKYTNNLLLYLHRKAFKMPTIIMFNQFVAHSFLIFCVLFARRCSLFAKNIDHTFNKQCKICTKTIRAERKTQIIIWKLIMNSFFFIIQLNRRIPGKTVYYFYLYR